MIRRTWITRLFTAAVAIVASAGTADAGLLPVSVTVQPEAGNFRWTYSVVLPSDMQLQSGSYFTIYDFAGYQSGSGMVSSSGPDASFSQYWALSTDAPTSGRINAPDDPTVPDLTFTYTGPNIPAGQLTLGNFIATSTFGTTAPSFFAGSNPTVATGEIDNNITSTLSPRGTTPPDPVGTPEPTTLVLAGLGLPLVGLRRYLRRKA